MYCRNAVETDIPYIMKLLEQVNLIHHQGRPDIFKRATKYSYEELKRIIRDPLRPIFVADDGNGVVVGYAFCVFEQFLNDHMRTDIKTLYIDDLCVDENVRGKKIGTQLYHHVVSYARENGCYNVTLNVWALNEDAMRFYESIGMHIQKIGMETIL